MSCCILTSRNWILLSFSWSSLTSSWLFGSWSSPRVGVVGLRTGVEVLEFTVGCSAGCREKFLKGDLKHVNLLGNQKDLKRSICSLWCLFPYCCYRAALRKIQTAVTNKLSFSSGWDRKLLCHNLKNKNPTCHDHCQFCPPAHHQLQDPQTWGSCLSVWKRVGTNDCFWLLAWAPGH